MFRTSFFALACVVATTEGLKLSALATEPIYSPAYLAQGDNDGGAAPVNDEGNEGDKHGDGETNGKKKSGPVKKETKDKKNEGPNKNKDGEGSNNGKKANKGPKNNETAHA